MNTISITIPTKIAIANMSYHNYINIAFNQVTKPQILPNSIPVTLGPNSNTVF